MKETIEIKAARKSLRKYVLKNEKEAAEKIISCYFPSSYLERIKVDALGPYLELHKSIVLSIRKLRKEIEKKVGFEL